jgi:hypothetical protein
MAEKQEKLQRNVQRKGKKLSQPTDVGQRPVFKLAPRGKM